ncbi:MAG: para-aminobenzoate synthetase [Sphingomonadales bacterium]|jgi:GMP synthase-like glutamine amidotransferase|nr:para-aminobenzoate synthetase [Sphingomonadales bacterium]
MYLIVDNHDAMCVEHLVQILEKRGETWLVLDRTARLDEVEVSALQGIFLSGSDDLDVTAPLPLSEIALDTACLIGVPVPIFGICGGFELVVALCGGILAPVGDELPQSCVPVSVTRHVSVLWDLPPEICMMEFNTIHATALPDCLIPVASSKRSPFEAVIHATRPIIATQFHPEATDAQGRHSPEGLRIVGNFLDWCDATPPRWWR